MDALHHHIRPREGDLIVGKVPDPLDAGGHQPLAHHLGGRLGHCEQPHAGGVLRQEGLQSICVIDGDAGDLGAHRPLLHIKGGQELKAVVGKFEILNEGPAQVARPQHDDGVSPVDPQDLADLLFEHVHLIPVPLLPEAAEAEQVLADLRRSQPDGFPQGAGGDPHDPLALKL